jgi:hypothetical protein
VVILAMPLADLLPLLDPSAPTPKAQRWLGRLAPGRRLAALHLVVRPGALPPGLGGAALLLPAGAAPDQAVLVEIAAARREAKAEARPDARHVDTSAPERLVSAWTLAPASGDASAAQARLEAALVEALPFHQAHVVHRLQPAPAAHLVSVKQPALGVGGLPVRTPWKNLLLANREVLPGLGLEGELYAGLQAAARASTLLGARDKRH